MDKCSKRESKQIKSTKNTSILSKVKKDTSKPKNSAPIKTSKLSDGNQTKAAKIKVPCIGCKNPTNSVLYTIFICHGCIKIFIRSWREVIDQNFELFVSDRPEAIMSKIKEYVCQTSKCLQKLPISLKKEYCDPSIKCRWCKFRMVLPYINHIPHIRFGRERRLHIAKFYRYKRDIIELIHRLLKSDTDEERKKRYSVDAQFVGDSYGVKGLGSPSFVGASRNLAVIPQTNEDTENRNAEIDSSIDYDSNALSDFELIPVETDEMIFESEIIAVSASASSSSTSPLNLTNYSYNLNDVNFNRLYAMHNFFKTLTQSINSYDRGGNFGKIDYRVFKFTVKMNPSVLKLQQELAAKTGNLAFKNDHADDKRFSFELKEGTIFGANEACRVCLAHTIQNIRQSREESEDSERCETRPESFTVKDEDLKALQQHGFFPSRYEDVKLNLQTAIFNMYIFMTVTRIFNVISNDNAAIAACPHHFYRQFRNVFKRIERPELANFLRRNIAYNESRMMICVIMRNFDASNKRYFPTLVQNHLQYQNYFTQKDIHEIAVAKCGQLKGNSLYRKLLRYTDMISRLSSGHFGLLVYYISTNTASRSIEALGHIEGVALKDLTDGDFNAISHLNRYEQCNIACECLLRSLGFTFLSDMISFLDCFLRMNLFYMPDCH